MTRKRVATLLGVAIGIVGMAFVVRLLVGRRDEVEGLLAATRPQYLVLAFVLGLGGMTLIGTAWNRLLAALDRPIPWRVAYRGYFVGQLGKYVPGGVWAVVGRGEWARRSGVTAIAAYSSTMLSVGTAYLAACVLAVVVVPIAAPTTGLHPLSILVVVLGVVGVPMLHPRVMELALRLLTRLTGRTVEIRVPAYHESLEVLGLQVVTWLLIGTGTWLVAVGLGIEITWVVAVAATCVSWVVGLLVLPVPGGIGIREGVFVAVLGGAPEIAALALATRIVAIAVDASGAALATAVAGRTPSKVEQS